MNTNLLSCASGHPHAPVLWCFGALVLWCSGAPLSQYGDSPSACSSQQHPPSSAGLLLLSINAFSTLLPLSCVHACHPSVTLTTCEYHNTTRRIRTNNRNIWNPPHSPSSKALCYAASATMSHNTSVAMSNNNVFVPYDIILEVFQHVDDDDLRILHSLLLTSKSLYRLAAPKAWATLYLTSHGSVASAFEAIMKNPELRP